MSLLKTTLLLSAASFATTAAWDNMLLTTKLPNEAPTRKSSGSSFKQNQRKAAKLKAKKAHKRRK